MLKKTLMAYALIAGATAAPVSAGPDTPVGTAPLAQVSSVVAPAGVFHCIGAGRSGCR